MRLNITLDCTAEEAGSLQALIAAISALPARVTASVNTAAPASQTTPIHSASAPKAPPGAIRPTHTTYTARDLLIRLMKSETVNSQVREKTERRARMSFSQGKKKQQNTGRRNKNEKQKKSVLFFFVAFFSSPKNLLVKTMRKKNTREREFVFVVLVFFTLPLSLSHSNYSFCLFSLYIGVFRDVCCWEEELLEH